MVQNSSLEADIIKLKADAAAAKHGGKQNYDDKLKDAAIDTFTGKERQKFKKWDKRLRNISSGRGFANVRETLDWAKNEKDVIKKSTYEEKAEAEL